MVTVLKATMSNENNHSVVAQRSENTMVSKVCITLSIIIIISAASAKPAFWKDTSLDSTVEKMRSLCEADNTIACFQYKALSFLNTILQRNYFQFNDNVEITRNSYSGKEISSRSDDYLETGLEEFIKKHDIKFNIPIVGSVTVDSKSLDNDEIGFKVNFNNERAVEGRKKFKLKKIFIPILVFILLKAMTLVPFALGILGLKAWNGLQLAFFSFIISSGLAIFQLCQKLAADSAHTHIAASPGPWEALAANQYASRSLDTHNQLAYPAYIKK